MLPSSVDEALRALAEHPGASVLAGGTDLMVEVNGGHRRVDDVVALGGIGDLRGWRHDRYAGMVTIGAGLTYSEMLHAPLATMLPALAEAARTVGSPQIRNAGTIGGNLGTASPAGDTLPVLSALDAVVEIAGPRGRRAVVIHDYLRRREAHGARAGRAGRLRHASPSWRAGRASRRSACATPWSSPSPTRAWSPTATAGPSGWRSVPSAPRSCGPGRPRRGWPARSTGTGGAWPTPRVAAGFQDRVAAEARPIDDHRSTADYRRHAVGVLARRLLHRAFPR